MKNDKELITPASSATATHAAAETTKATTKTTSSTKPTPVAISTTPAARHGSEDQPGQNPSPGNNHQEDK